ncbi:MAG: CaiB/BaiF CoA-transferase family protein [Vicinamibacterales bacterium]
MAALTGIRVLDFSTLLPGPLATLILAEAGADVIKIERPGGGDEMRAMGPSLEGLGVWFAMLNRGKAARVVDLKDPTAVRELRHMLPTVDVVVEQFRPGVMARLGLGPHEVREINPRVVYCSITGFGQDGPDAGRAGHDLTYLAESGLLSLVTDRHSAEPSGRFERPVLPPGLLADIAGGAYPAVMNILLALRQRESTGLGCHLDISMADGLWPFAFWALGEHAAGRAPSPGRALFTGGSPRYQIYETADRRFVAAAPLEQRFWDAFCDVIGLPAAYRDDARDPDGTIVQVAACVRLHSADEWASRFEGRDVCCAVVRSLEEAMVHPHVKARGVLLETIPLGTRTVPALPVPLAQALRRFGGQVLP